MVYLTNLQLERMDFNVLLSYVKKLANQLDAGSKQFNNSQDYLFKLCNVLNQKIEDEHKKTLEVLNKGEPDDPLASYSDRIEILKEQYKVLIEETSKIKSKK